VLSEENKAITRCEIDDAWNKGNIGIINVFMSSNYTGTSLALLSSCRVSTRNVAKIMITPAHPPQKRAVDPSQALNILPSLREEGERNPGHFDLRTGFHRRTNYRRS